MFGRSSGWSGLVWAGLGWAWLGWCWAGLGWSGLGRGNHSNESSESNPRLCGDKRGIRLTALKIVITDRGILNTQYRLWPHAYEIFSVCVLSIERKGAA